MVGTDPAADPIGLDGNPRNAARGRTSDRALAIARRVDAIADELDVSSAQVATAWVAGQGYRYISIVGARKFSQIEDTLKSVRVELPSDALVELDTLSRVELGFPHDFLRDESILDVAFGPVRKHTDFRPGESFKRA
ncbi:MAG: aldo/keto reductase [Polyangiales bacterium]